MSHLRKPDQAAMERNAGMSESEWLGVAVTGAAAQPDDPQPVLQVTQDEPDEPLSTWLPTSIRLDANCAPQTAAYLLRTTYTAEWIAELQVCLNRTETPGQ